MEPISPSTPDQVLPPETGGAVFPNFPAERELAREPIAAHTPARSRRISSEATWLLLAINIGVYLWMVLHGVSATSPTPDDLVRYGANATDVTLAGQWYRVLTATFVHVGIIHLATNMWCLYNLGLLGEPLLGRWGLIATYVITGIAGNLLSLLVNVVTHNLSVGGGGVGRGVWDCGYFDCVAVESQVTHPRPGARPAAAIGHAVCGVEPGDRARDLVQQRDSDRQHGAYWRISIWPGAWTAAGAAHDERSKAISWTAEDYLCGGSPAAAAVCALDRQPALSSLGGSQQV